MSSGLQATILARAGLLDRPAWPAQRRGVAQRHLPLRRHPRQLHRDAPAPRRRPLPRLLLPDGRRGDARGPKVGRWAGPGLARPAGGARVAFRLPRGGSEHAPATDGAGRVRLPPGRRRRNQRRQEAHLHDDPCPSPRHRARGAFRFAQPLRCAPTQHRDRAQRLQIHPPDAAQPARKGPGDTE